MNHIEKPLVVCGAAAAVLCALTVILGAAIYTFISLGVVFIPGGLAAYTAASGGRLVGAVERLTIGAFLQWMFVTVLVLIG